MKNSKIYSEDVPLSAIYESKETPSVEPIPEYVPTQWVDDLEPDIDADHLNHIEDGIKRATDGVNNLIENGGGSFTPSDGYVFVEQEESEEDIPPVPEPMLDADALGGMPVTFFAPQNQIGDAFSEGRDYAAGDYCIRLNTLHKFTAGPWDASKVVACTVMEEVGELNGNFVDIRKDAGDSFKTKLNVGRNRITPFAFYANPADNPFSFPDGVGISFWSNMMFGGNSVLLLGIPVNSEASISVARLRF